MSPEIRNKRNGLIWVVDIHLKPNGAGSLFHGTLVLPRLIVMWMWAKCMYILTRNIFPTWFPLKTFPWYGCLVIPLVTRKLLWACEIGPVNFLFRFISSRSCLASLFYYVGSEWFITFDSDSYSVLHTFFGYLRIIILKFILKINNFKIVTFLFKKKTS